MAASLPVMAIFIWWQKYKDRTGGSPLILPSLFKNHSFGIGLSINMIFEMSMIGFFLTFGLMLQIGLGFTPIHAALTGVPLAVGIGATMGILGKTIPKLGRYALSIGTVLMGVGATIVMLIIYHYGLSLHSWQLIPGLIIMGTGMGCVFGALFAAVLNGVDPKHAGSASGTLNAVQQVGGVVGVAIVGVIFFGQLSLRAPASFNSVEPSLQSSLSVSQLPASAQQQIIGGAKNCFIDISREKDSSVVPAICRTPTGSSSLPRTIGKAISTTAAKANAKNFSNAFRWSIIYTLGVLAFTFGITFLLPPKFKTDAYSEI